MSSFGAFVFRLCSTAALSVAVTLTAIQPVAASPVASTATAANVDQAELECLAKALYFEARGEPASGQRAVAEVILNRVDSSQFPSTVCAVVTQSNRNGCQFSYQCNGRSQAIREKAAYARVHRVAETALSGAPRDLTDGATYFHTHAVRPSWSRKFVQTTRIGAHIFYRPGQRIAAN